MSLFKIFDITGSAMKAQNTRLNMVASNLANADTIASTPEEAYRAKHPIFSTILQQQAQNGTPEGGVSTVGVMESQVEPLKRYEPGNPLADEEGYVYGSNVNTIEEMTNMVSASRSYQTNVEVLTASKRMLMETLKIGQ